MIASEAQPFSKTGGLADVATALPKALGRLGHDVTLITPRYRGVADGPVVGRVSLEVAGASLHRAADRSAAIGRRRARVLLLDCPELYDRAGIYYDARGDFADNAVRFAFLSAAAIDWASQQDDAVRHHSRARLAGRPAPVYARARASHARTRAPYGLHDSQPGVSGLFDKSWVPRLGLPWDDFTINGFEFFDRLEFHEGRHQLRRCDHHGEPDLRGGDPASGVRLRPRRRDPRSRRDALVGILNGIDHDEWNPAADPFLPAPFDAEQPRRARRRRSARCSRRSASRSPTNCWRAR